MKVTEKGQITIPKELRDALGIGAGTDVEFEERLGIPLDDGLRDAASSPMLQLFQRVLFARSTPNLCKIGLLSDHLRERLVAIAADA